MLSCSVADAINCGAGVLGCYTYLVDRRNRASMLTIPFGHTQNVFSWSLGNFAIERTAASGAKRSYSSAH